MSRLTRTIHHTAHHGDLHVLDAGVTLLPLRHPIADVGLNLLRHRLKEGRRGASATGACRDLRLEASQAEGLKDLLSDAHFFGAIAIRPRSKRHSNRVADTLCEKNRERARAGDDALVPHSGF